MIGRAVAETAWTYPELDRMYPPQVQTCVKLDTMSTLPNTNAAQGLWRVDGLSDVPEAWPDLPDNASLAVEIGWFQAQRLRVVEEKDSGAVVVHLDRARTPTPSWAALGWLETSIRSYAKYVDVAAKATATAQDEAELVRREKMQIEEIRELLAEMDEQMAADMLADTAATVRERVHAVVPDCCGRCGIDESHRQWLEGHVCQLVMDLLNAAGVETGAAG